MINRIQPCLWLVMLGILLAGCDSTIDSNHSEKVVIESYLVADEPMPTVWISRSIPVGSIYNPAQAVVRDALVVMYVLDDDGKKTRSILFEESVSEPGAYHSVTDERVLPGATYRLEVRSEPNAEIVWAETTVPADFELIEPSATEIAYKDPAQFSMLVTQSPVEGGQSVFVFTMESLEPTLKNLIPAYREFIYDEKIDDLDTFEWSVEDFKDFLIFSSPPIFEGNYEVFPNGTLRVKLPWFAVAFYGPLKVTMTTLDKNLYDFQRYQQVQQGGSTLSPGEIPNVLDHVENGRGLFGSSSRVTAFVDILKESN